MPYIWDFAILGKYSHLFWHGLGWTIGYTILTVLLGTGLGLVVGILRLRRLPVIDWLLLAYIELFRCTPLLVQIIWFYYALPVLIGLNIPAPVAAVISTAGAATSKSRVSVLIGPESDETMARNTYCPGGNWRTSITCEKIIRSSPAVRPGASAFRRAGESASVAISYFAFNDPTPAP